MKNPCLTTVLAVAVLVTLMPLGAAFSTRTSCVSRPLTFSTRRRRRRTASILWHQASSTDEQEREEQSTLSLALPNWEPFGKGVKRDVSNRFPEYTLDITDGLNAQSLATVLFLFFACLAPAIGFGSVLGTATASQMGVLEMVASTSLSGVLYAALSSQPVQLIGPQGPVVAYITALYAMATQVLKVPFLPFYAWTGLWASGFLAVLAATSASNLVQHLTRWTDEIFSVLVSTLFLFQAVRDISSTFAGKNNAVTALLTPFCSALTFGTAVTLKQLPTTCYLTVSWRKNLANFAPAIGVVVGSVTARVAKLHWTGVSLAALALPAQFTTSTGRAWLVSLAQLPVTARWWAAIPAFLAVILLYLDQNITARLVNHPRFMQVKGKRQNVMDGMHGDMLALAGITALVSVLGLPWMCGAPTRSAAHVRALSKLDDKGNVVGTMENRVSGFSIHALIGLCAIATRPRQLLAQVPKPVLSGVFLFLGFTSLQGLELWDRIKGLAKDEADVRFAAVKRRVVTTFTFAQMVCVAAMMKLTESKYGVLSPLLIAFLPLVRRGLIKTGIISEHDMKVLDN